MAVRRGQRGFSLTEVLLAVGTLAVGMVFIAGVFPVAIYYAAISSERTIAAVVAEEAFAKIQQQSVHFTDSDFISRLYDDQCVDFNEVLHDVLPLGSKFEPREFRYPSTDFYSDKQYCWSAILRLVEDANSFNPRPLIQVTVFVSRKNGPSLKYPDPDGGLAIDWPAPYEIEDVAAGTQENELEISDATGKEKTYVNDGSVLVDDRTGRLYRVLDRYRGDDDDTVRLDKDWIQRDWNEQVNNLGTHGPDNIWVIPPPVGGGRNPCVGVYQRLIRF